MLLLLFASAAARHECTGWHQTAQCKGNGPREPYNDAACTIMITNGRSGFCECTRQSGAERLSFDCGHAPFTCNNKCAKSADRSPTAHHSSPKTYPKTTLKMGHPAAFRTTTSSKRASFQGLQHQSATGTTSTACARRAVDPFGIITEDAVICACRWAFNTRQRHDLTPSRIPAVRRGDTICTRRGNNVAQLLRMPGLPPFVMVSLESDRTRDVARDPSGSRLPV